MKRTKLVRRTPLNLVAGRKPRKPLRLKGVSTSAQIKDRIQALVRAIVIKRDGGCILRNIPQLVGPCNGYNKDGNLILQADHLITRGNSATFADTRLIVCLCKGHHGGYKKWNKERYDVLVRDIIGPVRSKLWDDCLRSSYKATHMTSSDWKLAEVALEQEKMEYNKYHPL